MNTSSQPRFTPGPWQLGDGYSLKTASGSFYLAYGNHPKSGRPEFRKFVELDANARLISAAPEMYDTLQRVAEFFDGMDSDLGNLARSVLAKAREGNIAR